MNPGVVSHLGREHDEEVAEAITATSKYWKNSDEGGSTSLVAALDPSLDGKLIVLRRATILPLLSTDLIFFSCRVPWVVSSRLPVLPMCRPREGPECCSASLGIE